MALDSGGYTRSTPPVTDPALSLSATASNDTSNAVITYTTASAHNLVVGQPVITSGFSNAWLNYNPDSGTGNGTPAIVASVTSSTVFTVKTPAAFSTSSSSVSGTVFQQALVSGSPYGDAWLPTTAQKNVVVAREWGNSFPIQPNKDATDGDIRTVAVSASAVSGNGAQVTFTVGSGHGLVAGQTVTIQGVVPASYNFDTVQIASTGSTSIVFNSTVTDAVVSSTNALIVPQLLVGGPKQATVSAATGATQQATVTPSLTATAASGATTLSLATTSVVVGAAVSATAVAGIAAGTVVTAVGTGSVTINPATSTSVASASVITIAGTRNVTYRTSFPHNLTSGQQVYVSGSSNASYNAIDKTATVIDSKTFSVSAPVVKIVSIATAASSVTITTETTHGVTTSDYINVAGVTGGTVTAINTTSTQPSAVTANTITYTASSPVLATPTSYGTVVKSSGAFSGSAYVGGADNGWAYTYNYPSAYLDPTKDNHDRVTNADSSYPAFTPTYYTPNIVGLTTTNAIQKLRAAGQTPGNVQFSTDLTVSAAAASGSDWVYTTGTTTHNLSVGDTVNLSGGTSGAVANNLGDAVVGAVSGFTFTIKNVTGTTTVTSLVARPKNTIVSAQTPSAGSTTATVVGFTRNYGI
jgi:hypothetical protein